MPPKKDLMNIDTKTSRVYKRLKSDIIKCRLKSGDKLVVTKVAEYYGISASPVREAFGQLKAEGFLDVVPHTGIYVKEIDIDYLQKIYPVRGLLEGYATRIACPLLTPRDFNRLHECVTQLDGAIGLGNYSKFSALNYEFHMTIYKAAKNDYLIKIIDDLLDNTDRVRGMYDLIPARAEDSNREHKRILESLKKGEIHKAEGFVTAHIGKTLHVLLKCIEAEKGKVD